MNPFFSIVIPVYNVERYLPDCLDSIMNQSYNNYEIICVNDGSTDNSLCVLEDYMERDGRVKIISQANKGLSSARNAGIREAKGEYILFVDSDDWLISCSLETLAGKASGEDMVCFSGKLYYEDTGLEVVDTPLPDTVMSGWNYYNAFALKTRMFSFVCAVLRLYRRKFLLQKNLYFEEGLYHEDNLFTPIACYYADSVRLVSDVVYVYRIRGGSITTVPQKKRMFDMIAIANQLSDFFIPKQDIEKSVLYKALAGMYYLMFLSNIQKEFSFKDRDVVDKINWTDYKQVSVSRRHKLIYRLIRLNPIFFRIFIKIEALIKK